VLKKGIISIAKIIFFAIRSYLKGGDFDKIDSNNESRRIKKNWPRKV